MKKYILSGAGFLISSVAQGAIVTVGPGTPEQDWSVSAGTELNIVTGGVAKSVSASSTTVRITDGGRVNGRVYLTDASVGVLSRASISARDDTGLNLTRATRATVADSQIDSNANLSSRNSRGINVNGASLIMSGTEVYGHGSGTGKLDVEGGLGMAVLTGTADINTSRITGDRFGMFIASDTFGTGEDYFSSVNLSDTRVESIASDAIKIARPNTRNSLTADLTINNGSTLFAGNGVIINTASGAVSNIIVNDSQLTGNIVNEATTGSRSSLTMQNGASLTGRLLEMTSSDFRSGTTWTVTGDSSVGSLTNAGDILFSGDAAGRTLTVGNYTGGNGLIAFNSVLGDDSSQTDRLIITGDTSGDTRVRVNNLGGSGAKTLNGIELITVSGQSAGTFTQDGRIVAGSFEYYLGRYGKDWRLCSGDNCNGATVPPIDPPVLPPVEPPVTPPVVPPVEPPVTPPVVPADLILRPEAGSYLANAAAAANMFGLTRSDRLQTADPHSGMWMYAHGSRTSQHDTTGQLSTKGNSWVTLLGGDVYHTSDGRGSAGIMGGYGYSTSKTHASRSGYGSEGSVRGYSAGLYASWSEAPDAGLYTDAWLQYSTFRGVVKGDELQGEKYRLRGPSASLEAGYAFGLWQGEVSRLTLTPSAQVEWSGIRARNHQESNGTRVTAQHDDNIRSRLGTRLALTLPAGSGSVTPFMAITWLNNSQPYGVVMDGVAVSQAGSRNVAEFRAGVEGQAGSGVRLSGALVRQQGQHSYSNTGAMLGISVPF